MAIRFINILKDLILETSRFEFIYNKYTKNKEGNSDEIPIDTLIELINSDPTSKIPEKINKENLTTQDMESIRVGKYAQWIIKNYVYSENKDLFLEDLYKVTGDLMKFERFKNRLPQEYRDINKLTVDELYNQVKDFSLEKTKASTEEKKEASKTYQHPGGEIVYRGSQWTVVRISNQGQLGKDAACFYGGYHLEPQKGETRWCTSSPGLNFFEKYIKDGPLYVVIPNSPRKFTGDMEVGEKTGLPALRYQFHFPSNQFMDPADKKIKISDFINQNPEFKELFKEDFLKNIIKNNNDNEIVISELNNNLDFIKTYGINEYLDKINKNIKTFKYIPFRENIIINFEKIGNFENLEEVKINNGGLETIPSSFCNLKNLKVLDLKGNPKIKTIPKCFSQLPNLKLIYIGNTDDLIIPEKIKEKSDITKNIISFEKENFDFVKDKTKNKILNIFFKFGLEETGFDFKTLAQTLGIKTPEQYLDLFKNIKTEKQKGGYHFYFYSNNILMTYDEYGKILYVNTDKFYGMFSKAFGLEYEQSSDMMKNWMENKYGVKPDLIATAFDSNFNK